MHRRSTLERRQSLTDTSAPSKAHSASSASSFTRFPSLSIHRQINQQCTAGTQSKKTFFEKPQKGMHRVGVYFLHQGTPPPPPPLPKLPPRDICMYTCTATGENRHFPFLHAFILLTCCYRPSTIGDQRDKTTFSERDPVTSHHRPHFLSLNGHLVASC